MKYKAIIFDVDGTLIPNTQHGMPSKKVIEAVKKAKEKAAVSIATARSFSMITHITDALQLTSPCIITGGAQIIDPISKEILAEIGISKNDTLTIIELGKRYGISFTASDAGYPQELSVGETYVPIRPLDLYSQLIPVKEAQEFIEKISHIPTVEAHKALGWGVSDKVHVTITHPLASKQYGVLEFARMQGITPEEIIGVGEGYNDFSFLMSCGLKVAMGNAIDPIKKIADYVAPSVEDDGAADAIEKFILHQAI